MSGSTAPAFREHPQRWQRVRPGVRAKWQNVRPPSAKQAGMRWARRARSNSELCVCPISAEPRNDFRTRSGRSAHLCDRLLQGSTVARSPRPPGSRSRMASQCVGRPRAARVRGTSGARMRALRPLQLRTSSHRSRLETHRMRRPLTRWEDTIQSVCNDRNETFTAWQGIAQDKGTWSAMELGFVQNNPHAAPPRGSATWAVDDR